MADTTTDVKPDTLSPQVTPAVLDAVLGRRFFGTEHKVARQRLASALQQVESDLRLALAEHDPGEALPAPLAEARAKFASAIQAAVSQDNYQAWDLLQQIERLVAASDTDTERLAIRLLRYGKEADEKLTGWRKAVVQDKEADLLPPRQKLLLTMEILHQASQNAQLKITLLREQARYLLILLSLTLALILHLGRGGHFAWIMQTGAVEGLSLGEVMATGALIGFFGGLMSVAFAVSRTDVSIKIPLVRSTFSVQTLRPALGAAAAIPVIILFQAGFINFGSNGPVMLAAFCFLAGFSERWFIDKLDAAANPPAKK